MNDGVLGKEQEAYLESSRAKELASEAFNARGGGGWWGAVIEPVSKQRDCRARRGGRVVGLMDVLGAAECYPPVYSPFGL